MIMCLKEDMYSLILQMSLQNKSKLNGMHCEINDSTLIEASEDVDDDT
jgi:hypothetical protein